MNVILKVLPLFLLSNLLFGQDIIEQNNRFDLLGKYEIIAFGEASHGSKSDYIAREDLIRSVINDTDSLGILIEMPYYAGIAIQKYRNNMIDSFTMLKEFKYFGLCTDGFLHLINEFKYDKRITFYGIDMQTHLSSLKLLKLSLIESFPEIENIITKTTDSLNYDFGNEYTRDQYIEYSATINRCMTKLFEIIHSNDLLLHSKFLEVNFPFTILQQYFGCMNSYKIKTNNDFATYSYFRDSCMTENVCKLKTYSNNRIILLASNSHVVKAESHDWIMMGGRLKRKYGANYFVIGSQYIEGKLLEVDIINNVRSFVPKTVSSIKRTLPYKLKNLLKPTDDTLIVIESTKGKLNKTLKKKAYYQSFGVARHNDKRSSYHIGTVSVLFDALYLITNVDASVYVPSEK